MSEKPIGQTVIFFRAEGGFYPIQLWGREPIAEECANHAQLNPGTLRIEDMNGNVIWPEGTKQ